MARSHITRSRVGCPRFAHSAVALAAALLALPATAAETLFIGEFEALGRDWVTQVDRALTVEGRLSTFGGGRMRFAGSSLSVELPKSTRRPSTTDRVRVSGLLKSQRGQPVLEAFRFEALPDTETWVIEQEAAVEENAAEGWFAAADAVRTRGRYYDDPSLLEAAAEMDAKGLTSLGLEAGSDPDKLLAAAARAEERELPRVEWQPLLHQSAVRRWEQVEPPLEDATPETLPAAREAALALAEQIRRDLPGATKPSPEPLTEADLEEAARYRRLPDRTYREADPEERPRLHRFLLAQLLITLAEAELAVDEDRGDELAARLERDLPERPDVADRFRERGLDVLLENLPSLSEAEVLAVGKRLRERRGEEAERTALVAWLASRRESARLDGAGALFRLADDTERLTGDVETAAELAQEALAADPRYAAAVDWLGDRGYEQVAGRWRKKADKVPKPRARPGAVARLEVGLTAEEVTELLRFEPDAKVRMATFGRITEYWTYEGLGRTLTIERIGRSSRVVAIAGSGEANDAAFEVKPGAALQAEEEDPAPPRRGRREPKR